MVRLQLGAEEPPVQQMRAVVLSGYVDVASSVGLDGARLLRQAGISLETLEDPENRLPATAVIRLLERSAEESACEYFGLLMAERRTFASLGPVSLLLERLPNLRAVVRAAIVFQRHLNDVVSITLEEEDGTSLIKLDLSSEFWGTQTIDLMLAIAYSVLVGATGGRWKPACVHTMRKRPRDPALWRRIFPVPIEFEDNCNGFSAATASLLIPLPLADETMERNAHNLLRLLPLASGPEVIGDKVRRTISLLLPSGRATVDQVAAQLGLSSRSLQRRLDDEGLQFGELLSGVRQELATAYLANSARPVTSVAALLGYSSPSSFTRWFAGSFGMAPQAWRANHRDRAGPPEMWRR
jgi:AraC-like DNA-binding protein